MNRLTWANYLWLSVKATEDAFSCFPGDATVTIRDDTAPRGVRTVAMRDVNVGDHVLTHTASGENAGSRSRHKASFSPVYFFGHRDARAVATFLRITTASNHTLRLTPGHYVFVSRGGCGDSVQARARTLDASLIVPGDGVWVAAVATGILTCSPVTVITHVTDTGIYNPYTLAGSLVVDGVLASAHSAWDGVPVEATLRFVGLSAETVSHIAPYFYDALFAPLRLLYSVMGAEWAQAFATRVGEAEGYKGITLSKLLWGLLAVGSAL